MSRKRGVPEEGDDGEEEDVLEIGQEKDVSGFPEAEKDVAPSALIPNANKCLGKHIKKIGELLKKFDGNLSENQKKHLGRGLLILFNCSSQEAGPIFP